MLHVQTFAAITNLLLVLSESICRAIHCKHITVGSQCLCFPRRFHNLYNNPCCSTNPWHPLWLFTLSQIQRIFAISTQHFRGFTIAHWKYLFNILNGYFMESHLTSWFERYHRLNLSMYLTQGGCTYHHLQQYFSPCSGNYKRSSTYG
jgi:hypothetical protein